MGQASEGDDQQSHMHATWVMESVPEVSPRGMSLSFLPIFGLKSRFQCAQLEARSFKIWLNTAGFWSPCLAAVEVRFYSCNADSKRRKLNLHEQGLCRNDRLGWALCFGPSLMSAFDVPDLIHFFERICQCRTVSFTCP